MNRIKRFKELNNLDMGVELNFLIIELNSQEKLIKRITFKLLKIIRYKDRKLLKIIRYNGRIELLRRKEKKKREGKWNVQMTSTVNRIKIYREEK